MSTKVQPTYELKCSCNQYPWGKQGSNSLAATLCAKASGWSGDGPNTDFSIDEETSYAEMWMGSYPALPSYIAASGEDLQDVIDRYPKELMGEGVINKFGHSKLPFLPKVLSIAKALPLQVHPNKDMAAKLHSERPEAFTDPNHKPEIALALSEFEAFAGFRPLADVAALLKLEPLQRFVDQSKLDKFGNEDLREVVRSMLQVDDDTVKKAYDGIVALKPEDFGKGAEYIPRLAPRLAKQYADSDPGILVALITMNYIVLQPGEAIYVPADGIHAWLAGDIIECMARSNNVLNFGFCPRADRNNTDLVCDLLTFTPHSAQESMVKTQTWDRSQNGKTKLFEAPMSEFDVLETTLSKGEKEVLGPVRGPSVLVVTSGDTKMRVKGQDEVNLGEGKVFFVSQGNSVEFEAGKDGAVMYTAFAE